MHSRIVRDTLVAADAEQVAEKGDEQVAAVVEERGSAERVPEHHLTEQQLVARPDLHGVPLVRPACRHTRHTVTSGNRAAPNSQNYCTVMNIRLNSARVR